MESAIKQLLVLLTPLLFVANLVQSFFYLPEADRREGGSHMPHWLYYVLLFLFFGAMMFALTASSVPLMWVAVELTTLVSAPLIAYHCDKGSLEAMWKYLLICSIGIAFALFGTMLVLHAQSTGSARWYMAGFAFVLAGYGTKMGLAPFHTWLPDAHSEAPAPVSALLSGALLNCSFFAIVRFREMMPDAAGPFCDRAMLALGILSVAVGAVFMVRQTDFKRLLAYSSVEHMGLVMVLFSLCPSCGKVAGIALLAHIAAHSLTKTLLFQTAGNLLLAFRTRAVSVVQGLGVSMKGHAMLWLAGLILICGMPPSVLFLSELGLVLSTPIWVSATILALLFVVFAAMMKVALSMTMGRPVAAHEPLPKRLAAIPSMLLALLILAGTASCAYAAFCSEAHVGVVENGITAHRGDSLRFPENSLRAFAGGNAVGADWIETDVRTTADGKLVLLHDGTTKAYCSVVKAVSESTYAELRELDLAEKFRARKGLSLKECPKHEIVLFEDALDLILKERKARLSIQPKSDCVDSVMEIVRRKNALAWVGFNDSSLEKMRRVKELEPSVTVFWDRGKFDTDADIKTAKQCGFEWIVPSRRDITAEKVKKIHAAGIKVGVWTVNEPAEMKRFLEMGVDRIYTDDPLALKAILDSQCK